ncbi:MAG: SprT-like domain-containing protein [Bryobacteraceae bacterium]
MQVEAALFFESPEEIYLRVFRDLKPRTAPPRFRVEFCRFANPDSFARMEDGQIHIRIGDLLEGAPAPILEALAYVLLGKLLRRTVPAVYAHRYRLYLNRRDMRHRIDLIRQLRGRKFLSGPQGQHHNLETVFDELNLKYFNGLQARPMLGWSRQASRISLGHYDPSHKAIIISRILDSPTLPRLALEYVMYHEMLHLQHPVQTRGSRRSVHTAEFHQAERAFEQIKEAKALLKKL